MSLSSRKVVSGFGKGAWDSHTAQAVRAGLARGRREKMTTERVHKQEEGSVSSLAAGPVYAGKGENSVPAAFCVF